MRGLAVSRFVVVWVRFDTYPKSFLLEVSVKSMPNPVGWLRKKFASAQALVQEKNEENPRIPDCPGSVKWVDLGGWVKQAVQVFDDFGRRARNGVGLACLEA